MWKQLRDANWRVPYVGGWCLKYVQDAFGTDHPDPDAMNAWNDNYGNGNHPGELPPAGKTVPVYFSLGNVPQGHVAISLDDGTVASSTQAGSHPQGYLHPNLQNLINVYAPYNGGCGYLGWSEYVGTVHVVEQQTNNATDDQINQAYRDILERPDGADPGGLAHYRAYTNDVVRASLLASDERKIVVARHAATDAATAQAQIDAAKAVQALANQQTADAAAKVIADQQAAIAEIARQKAAQDVIDAQKLKDAQLADAKKQADAEALNTSDHSFILRLKNLITTIIKFFTNLKG